MISAKKIIVPLHQYDPEEQSQKRCNPDRLLAAPDDQCEETTRKRHPFVTGLGMERCKHRLSPCSGLVVGEVG